MNDFRLFLSHDFRLFLSNDFRLFLSNDFRQKSLYLVIKYISPQAKTQKYWLMSKLVFILIPFAKLSQDINIQLSKFLYIDISHYSWYCICIGIALLAVCIGIGIGISPNRPALFYCDLPLPSHGRICTDTFPMVSIGGQAEPYVCETRI